MKTHPYEITANDPWRPVCLPTFPVRYEIPTPCPFCADKFPVVEHRKEAVYRVSCRACAACGSNRSTVVAALTDWNSVGFRIKRAQRP